MGRGWLDDLPLAQVWLLWRKEKGLMQPVVTDEPPISPSAVWSSSFGKGTCDNQLQQGTRWTRWAESLQVLSAKGFKAGLGSFAVVVIVYVFFPYDTLAKQNETRM